MTDSISNTISNALSFSNALSGCIGAAATILFASIRARKGRQERLRARKRVLRAELECIRATYTLPQKEIHRDVWSKNICSMSLTQNYTTVYDANAENIGLLGDETSAAVVRAYTLVKSLIDMSARYTDMYDRCLSEITHSSNNKDNHAFLLEKLYSDILQKKSETFAAIDNAIEKLS